MLNAVKKIAACAVFPLIGYRRSTVSTDAWDQEYRDGRWDYLGDMNSLAGLSSIMGYCQFLAPRSILDVGCGAGLLAQKLKLLAYESYLGTDISQEAISQANRLADARTSFLCMDAQEFRPQGLFDVIIFNQCIYYMRDPGAVIAQYGKFLTPTGRIIVSMYDAARTRAAWSVILAAMPAENSMTIKQGKGRVVTKLLAPTSAQAITKPT